MATEVTPYPIFPVNLWIHDVEPGIAEPLKRRLAAWPIQAAAPFA